MLLFRTHRLIQFSQANIMYNGVQSIFFTNFNRNMINLTKTLNIDERKGVLALLLIISLVSTANSFPIFAHQFTITWLPGSGLTSGSTNSTTFALPAVYTGCSRYLTLAGFQLHQQGSIAFLFFLSTQTSTSQMVVFFPYDGTIFYTFSFYLVLVKASNWIWAYQQSYAFNDLSQDDSTLPVSSWISTQSIFTSTPTNVLNGSDFKVTPFVQWYWSNVSDTSKGHPIVLEINDWYISADFVQVFLFFNRTFPNNQLIKSVGVVVFVTNYTHLTSINIPNYFFTTGLMLIDNMFISSQFGGYDGNCLIGYYAIQVFPSNSKNGQVSILFDATMLIMSYSTITPTVSVGFKNIAFCFYHCPDGQYYSAVSLQCQNCTRNNCVDCSSLIANCTQCQQNTLACIMCVYGYGLTMGSTCETCTIINPNCKDCRSSTFCVQCINNTFFLNNNTCSVCSGQMVHCIFCSSATVCTACAPGYHVIGHPNQCLTCAQVMQNCVTCSNLTACEGCVNNTFAVVPPTFGCVLCSQLFVGCAQCNSNTCTQCKFGLIQRNGQKNCECAIGTYKDGVCVIPGCIYTATLVSGLTACLQCNSSDFVANPVNGHCKCLSGNLIETTCSNIPNCVAATLTNGQISCLFCNISGGFQSKPQNNSCICKDQYQMKEGVCSDICGDGFLMSFASQTLCDDGNLFNGDGCSSNCLVQTQYRCQNGSSTSPSVCFYIGSKILLQLNKVQKTSGKNQAVFQFKVSPVLNALDKLNFTQYFSLICDSKYTLEDIQYSSGIITVTAEYYSNFEGVPCNATLSFDRNVIRSPTAKTNFTTLSNNFPLTYSKNLAQIINFGFVFQVITYCVLAVYIISLPHKMIGAQILTCCQMVYLSNCFYKIPSFQFSIVNNFRLVTGYWSLFYSSEDKNLLPPFTSRVQITPFFLQSNLFVVCGLAIFLLLSLILKLVQLRPSSNDQTIVEKASKKTNLRTLCFGKLPQILYTNFIFPMVAGFLIILSVSALIHSMRLDNSLQSKYSLEINCIGLLFALVCAGIVFGVEFFGSQFIKNQYLSQSRSLVGMPGTKKWYISIFFTKQLILMLAIEVGVVLGSFSKLNYVLLLIQMSYFIAFLFYKPYHSSIDRVGAMFCTATQAYSIFLPVISQIATVSEDLFAIMLIVMFSLIVTSIILSMIRLAYVYKQTITRLFFQKQQLQKQKQPKITKQSTISRIDDERNEQEKERKWRKPYRLFELQSNNTEKLIQDFFNPYLLTILDQKTAKIPCQNFQNKESLALDQGNKQIQVEALANQKRRLKESLLRLKKINKKK